MGNRAKLGEILIEAGILDEAGLRNALAEKSRTGRRLGETLVDLKAITEDQLYWALSRQLQVPLIPEAKLQMVEVPPDVLALVPVDLARRRRVLPLLVESAKSTISVVTSEPNVVSVLEEIKRVTGMAYVRAFLAKRSAVMAAIGRTYGASGEEPRADITDSALILEEVPNKSSAPPPPPPSAIGRIELEKRQPSAPRPPAPSAAPPPPPGQARQQAKYVLLADPSKQVANGAARILSTEGFEVTIATSANELIAALKGSAFDLIVVKGTLTHNMTELEQRVRAVFPLIEFRVVQSFATAILGDPVPYARLSEFTFDALDSVLSLISSVDSHTRKRAHQFAQYGKLVAQRVSAPRKLIDEIYFAGLLEGFAPALARRRGGDAEIPRQTARTVALNLFANANPPYEVGTILRHVDERTDGSGQPEGLRGEHIPLGSRILAVIGEYIETTEPLSGKGLPKDQVIKLLREMAGRKFDHRIVEAFLSILRNEMILGNLASGVATAGGEEILLVDKDVATTSTLELRLVNEGYRVVVKEDGKEAYEYASQTPPALIISEIALPKMDGFNLCMELKSAEATQEIPFLFLSGKSDEFNMTKGLEIGADDFLPKPVNVEFLMTKLKRFVNRKPAAQTGDGVSGRLAEMGLVEMVQILGVGMKTVKIALEHPPPTVDNGSLFFQEGNIVHASTNTAEGNEAFYELVGWPPDTTFRIIPNEQPPERNVTVGNDFLILEALRRIDEAGAGIDQSEKIANP